MREFIFEDVFGSAVRMVWNPDIPSLTLEADDNRTITFDGKEALKVISFVDSL